MFRVLLLFFLMTLSLQAFSAGSGDKCKSAFEQEKTGEEAEAQKDTKARAQEAPAKETAESPKPKKSAEQKASTIKENATAQKPVKEEPGKDTKVSKSEEGEKPSARKEQEKPQKDEMDKRFDLAEQKLVLMEHREFLAEAVGSAETKMFETKSKPDHNLFFAKKVIYISSNDILPTSALEKKSEKEIKRILKDSPFNQYSKEQFIELVKNTKIIVSSADQIFIQKADLPVIKERLEAETSDSYPFAFNIGQKNKKQTLEYLKEKEKELEEKRIVHLTGKTVLSEDQNLFFSKLSNQNKKAVLETVSHILLEYYMENMSYSNSQKALLDASITGEVFNSFLEKNLNYKGYREFIEKGIIPYATISKEFISKQLIEAYIKAIQDNQKKTNTNPTNPRAYQMAEILQEKYPSVTQNMVRRLLKLKAKRDFEGEYLFDGWGGIKTAAKSIRPALFNNFIDTDLYYTQAENLIKTLKENNNGFIVTSATSGVPLSDNYFNNLLRIANRKKAPLVIMAVNRETEFLPVVKLIKDEKGNKFYESVVWTEEVAEKMAQQNEGKENHNEPDIISLHDIPNVYVLSHTINLTDHFTFNSTPVMAKNFNPLASLNRMFESTEGQFNIIGHPQLRMEVVPGPNNHLTPTILATTGSISDNLYPSRTNIQARVSSLAKAVHTMGAWYFTPADKDAGLNGTPAPGHYHATQLYQRSFIDPETNQSYKGIIADNTFYGKYNEKFPVEAEYVVLGDLHVGSTNPKMFKVLEDFLRKNPNVNILIHDGPDGYSINHHEAKQILHKSKDIESRIASLEAEIRRNIEVVNSMLSLTKGKVYFVVSNHPNWITQLLNDKDSYGVSINSTFLTEIRHAVETDPGLQPLEYLFKEREAHHRNHPSLEARKRLLESNVYVSDPNRVVVLKPGEPFHAGNREGPIILSAHGHNISGGRTGVSQQNAPNLGDIITGHTHKPAILFGAVNVGTFTKEVLGYTKESLISGWVNGFAVTYKIAGKSGAGVTKANLVTVPPLLEKYESDGNPLPPSKHLPGEIVPKRNDNEEHPEARMTSTNDNYKKKTGDSKKAK